MAATESPTAWAGLPGSDRSVSTSTWHRSQTSLCTTRDRVFSRLSKLHAHIPYIRALPLPALLIILLLLLINLVVWAICALVLISHPRLISTAALAYTLGLRHALDADHISAIDLMTRRLIASGQRPVTVGTFFSLGHSTIVVITCIVVAATAAGVSKRFGSFSTVGGIIGSSISAAFLILLGVMNGYILYRLILQLRKIMIMDPTRQQDEAWKVEGGGVLFRILKKLFKIIDQPWKAYPLGVLFGLGFDTSSEVALLGISSIQGAKGTNIWLILIFPVLFTVGMGLIDTIDGALMLSLYLKPMDSFGETKEEILEVESGKAVSADHSLEHSQSIPRVQLEKAAPLSDAVTDATPHPANAKSSSAHSPTDTPIDTDTTSRRAKDPLAFLYYSIILTTLTVIVALVIGTIQLLTMLLNVTHAHGRFWNGVAKAGEYYEVIGGSICASFVVVGIASVFAYKPWRRWVDREREKV